MTTELDPRTRIVLSWLREDAHEDAQRALLRALQEVDSTPQRRPMWPARRIADMNAYAKTAVAVAAVIVLAVAGLQLMPRNGASVGGSPTPTSSPTTSPTPTPTRVAAPSALPIGSVSLVPGRYALMWSGPNASVQVPAGWTSDAQGEGVFKNANSGLDNEMNWGGWAPPPKQVYGDACHSDGALKPVATTLDALVAALDAQAGTDATVSDVTLGGVAGKRIELVQSASIDRSKCSEGAEGPLKVWFDAGKDGYFAVAPGSPGIVVAAMVDGRLAVFIGAYDHGATAADIAELETVIASTRLGP